MRLVDPLRHRDFALLWGAESVSLLGDGIFGVAATWQAFAVWNSPTAMAVLGLAWTATFLPVVAVGGVVSDRIDRRFVMLAGHAIRGLTVAVLAALVLAGELSFTWLGVLYALYAIGDALFLPAFEATVPEVVPEAELMQASSLVQFMRPAALRLVGPAVGGAIVAWLGTGAAFALDGATFLVASAGIVRIRPIGPGAPRKGVGGWSDLVIALRFVRAERWLALMLASVSVAVLLMWGPLEMLLPFLVKNELGGSAGDVGVIFAAGGAGAILAAVMMSQTRGLRWPTMVMYLTWALSVFGIAGYALVGTVAAAIPVAVLSTGLDTVATIIWGTLIQQGVPRDLRGRVSGLTSLATFGLLPLSYAFTAPLASAVGPRATLLAAGCAGGAVTLAFGLLPGGRARGHTREAAGRQSAM